MPKKWADYSPTAKKIYICFMVVILTTTLIIWAIVLLDKKIYTDAKDNKQIYKSQTEVSREIKLTQDMAIAITDIIQMNGFLCPRAKIAYKRDPDAYGDVMKIWCGPKNKKGVFEKTIFRVTFTPMYDKTGSANHVLVVPWNDEMSDW
jgi:hypothetical protein|tara:strand:+ start:73 stop:516 length:444 start_codon:yes stop_codon:yes gene_type:complete